MPASAQNAFPGKTYTRGRRAHARHAVKTGDGLGLCCALSRAEENMKGKKPIRFLSPSVQS